MRRRRTSFGPGFAFTSTNPYERWQLVTNSANFQVAGAAYVEAEDVELSALGANLALEGAWPDTSSDLVYWRQDTSQGRDQYVKLVEQGYLFPTGHRAALVKIIERVFVPDPDGSAMTVAYLQVIQYIRVLEQLKTYPAFGQAFDGKSWPFTSVLVATTTSPLLDPKPLTKFPISGTTPIPTWGFPTYEGGQNVAWPLVLTDLAGTTFSVRTPLGFVEGVPVAAVPAPYAHTQYDQSATSPLCKGYNALAITDPTFPRQLNLGGRSVRFALEADGHPGGTTHPTLAGFLGATTTEYDPATSASSPSPASGTVLRPVDQPAFYPTLQSARIRLSAVETLTQAPLDDADDPLELGGVGITPYSGYVEMGSATGYTSANQGMVWAALTAPPNLLFGHTETIGGIGTPNSVLTGMSAASGPVGGAGQLDDYAANGVIHPEKYFGSLVSQILGGLPLSSILSKFVNPGASGPTAPSITDETDPATGVRTVSYQLQAALTPNQTIDGITFTVPDDSAGNFTMNAVTVIPPTGPSSYTVQGSIDPFTIDIVVLSVPFTSMTFTSSSGTKPDVVTQIGNIEFEGALSFLNALEQFVEDLGGDGFSISVTPSGITASFSISLPSIGVGVVNLQGLGMTAGVAIPFLGGAMLANFGFASQENPFTVTVMCFGGGGYFLAGFGLYGMESLTVSIQFEGQLALDLGVASGGVTLAAGFTFSFSDTTPPGDTMLTAFVQLDGDVEVLGIITISLELDITLTYANEGGTSYLTGTATMKASVSIGPFGITVPITVQKQFAGGSGGGAAADRAAPALEPHAPPPTTPSPSPAFGDVFSDATWSSYCSSFAG